MWDPSTRVKCVAAACEHASSTLRWETHVTRFETRYRHVSHMLTTCQPGLEPGSEPGSIQLMLLVVSEHTSGVSTKADSVCQ